METQTKIPRIYIWLPIIFGLIAIGCYIQVRRLENKIIKLEIKSLTITRDSLKLVIQKLDEKEDAIIIDAKQSGQTAIEKSKSINEKKIVKKQFVKPSLDSSYRDILNLP